MQALEKKILLISLAFLVVLSWAGCSSASYNRDDMRMEKINQSPQLKDGKFYNYKERTTDFGFFDIFPAMWNYLFAGKDRKPDSELPNNQIDFETIWNINQKELAVTWVGHSALIINLEGKIILTDPIYENSTAFMGPARYNGDVPLIIDEFPEIDYVLISHNHYDHLNIWTIKQIHEKVKVFVCPLLVGAELESAGVPREKIVELDWWEEAKSITDLQIVLTPAQHFSNRSIFDRDKTLWGSFVVKGKKRSFYFSGDTGYFEGFKKIGEMYGPFDITFLECGAYNEKWSDIHMMPAETVNANIELKGQFLYPIHWGTFDLALHAWYDPMIRVSKAADSLRIKLATPTIGETIIIDTNYINNRWWEKIINDSDIVKN